MKALVYTAPRRIELRELPLPVIKSREVLIKIRAAGICGSDKDGFLGRSKKRIPPLVLGHEFSGEIADAGSEVSRFRVGQAVAVYPLITCGRCAYCNVGQTHLCVERKLFGLDINGALAEYVAVPEQCVFATPSNVSFLAAALVEPFAVALHVVEQIPNLRTATGLVYGAGSLGVLICIAAKLLGARAVAVVDKNQHRLEVIKQLGADLIVNSDKDDPIEKILEWTGRQGVEFSVDAAGHSICRKEAIVLTRSGGIIVLVGLVDAATEFDAGTIIARELAIRGSYAYTRDNFAKSLSLIGEGKVPLELFVTRAQLDDGPRVFEESVGDHSLWTKVVFCT